MYAEILNNRRNIFYQIVFIIGFISMTFGILIYRKTIIPVSFLILIVVYVGAIIAIFDFKKFKNTYKVTWLKLYFFVLMQHMVSWGFIACTLFLYSNYYLSEGKIIEEKHVIIERSSLPGSKGRRSERKPLFRIKYEGEIKELVFSHQFYQELENYKYVNISIQKGFFNWDIIVDKRLEK